MGKVTGKATDREKSPNFWDDVVILFLEKYKKAIIMVVLGFPVLYFINFILEAKYEWKDLVSPADLLLPSIISVTVSVAFIALVMDKICPAKLDVTNVEDEMSLQEKRKLYHIEWILRLNIWVVVLFTSAIIFLVVDIFPIPEPTQRWIWIWAIFFIFGWFGQFLTVLFITQSKDIFAKQTKKTIETIGVLKELQLLPNLSSEQKKHLEEVTKTFEGLLPK